ncbi:precorrin-2 dehydrogenase/sirohydrochlorin ferrochelatase family protein [Natrarchaeobius oligotrophus]|uniref:precorrin-2 dehydrogenase n=1 Tax=Natrarchaeobius chitinivorans TaxID=1679083 RepID=A0A3N6MNG6_NATCH|nr:bifunctional precorrin-2 dehydrogenase/sirohydrochlorin ferrochelatase [Natrarchaeobius chitinivorans]RQG99040.1 bifunctional precorrin-2 dehydrogenase/sirohydrochlorin ferrochelatase [Natrarchaeobius chitinivorans]
MIPLLHDFSNATVLVFGGGPVGARKARRFAREARVIVISPAFTDRGFGTAELIRASPEPGEIGAWIDRVSPALVVAATDDEVVNDAVNEAARDRGLLVNRADRAGGREPGGVVVPATIRDDPVVVSIATGGTAPALSKHLRRELEESIDGAGSMASLCRRLRSELKSRDVSANRRREIVTDVVNSPDVWTALRSGTSNGRQVIEDVLEEELSDGGDGA